MIIETVAKVKSEPIKAKSSYGTWKVLADTYFYEEETEKAWSYSEKPFFFWNKKSAIDFINSFNKGS